MRVRSAREAKGWSQEHLAEASGVGLRTIQRVEAGARVSHENGLALCATLGIEPEDLPVASSVGPGTIPRIAHVRAAIDGAMAERGERPVWQKSDASASLLAGVGRMGLPPDADGLERAWKLVDRRRGRHGRARVLLAVAFLAWVLAIPFGPALAGKVLPGGLDGVGWFLCVLTWGLAGIGVAMMLCAAERAAAEVWPSTADGIRDAGIVEGDRPTVEAAVTPGFLWVARLVHDEPRVIRLTLDSVRHVSVNMLGDGFNVARFDVGTLPWVPWCEDTSFEITRLRDDEARWLERRFPAPCQVVGGRLQATA